LASSAWLNPGDRCSAKVKVLVKVVPSGSGQVPAVMRNLTVDTSATAMWNESETAISGIGAPGAFQRSQAPGASPPTATG
jgi:hypothetical protein